MWGRRKGPVVTSDRSVKRRISEWITALPSVDLATGCLISQCYLQHCRGPGRRLWWRSWSSRRKAEAVALLSQPVGAGAMALCVGRQRQQQPADLPWTQEVSVSKMNKKAAFCAFWHGVMSTVILTERLTAAENAPSLDRAETETGKNKTGCFTSSSHRREGESTSS